MTTSRIEMVRKMATAPKGEIFHVSNFISFPALSLSLSLAVLFRPFFYRFSPLSRYTMRQESNESSKKKKKKK